MQIMISRNGTVAFTNPRIFDSKNSIGFSVYNNFQWEQSGYSLNMIQKDLVVL